MKVLTAVADKLNYNVDVNALEAFMPSAAQTESMRKLTEMLGYNMKYYNSATTTVKISYNLAGSAPIQEEFVIDRFTNIKDIDDTINYVTLNEKTLDPNVSTAYIDCIEGELVECETDNDNIVSVMQLDDNNRYYLPETQVAENGIFINNIINETLSEDWDKVDNLNTRPLGEHCYKFGFDSKENLPYIQFPDDIANIIEDGLKIKYIRTKGVSGNISARVLYKLEKPVSWQVNSDEETDNAEEKKYLDVTNYTVLNSAAATNGCNPETLKNAYNNYKKTIGTFDTLVTCRDYMNKIYQLTFSDVNTQPLVSNIIVSDIRDDINKAFTLCTFGEHGIEYKNMARPVTVETGTMPAINTLNTGDAGKNHLGKIYKTKSSSNEDVYYEVIKNLDGKYEYSEVSNRKIDHFDLVFYPFTSVNNLNNRLEFVKSFNYDDSTLLEIETAIAENKTIAHNIVKPNKCDIACIKVYYKLNVKIIATRKVNVIEQKSILENINTELYKNFNMRNVDFGEQLPDDEIEQVIREADPRIKDVIWNDPDYEVKACTVDGQEYSLSNTIISGKTTEAPLQGKLYYNKLVLNNVLAGRIPLFNYDETFEAEFNEVSYPTWTADAADDDDKGSFTLLYPTKINDEETTGISKIETEFRVTTPKNLTLNANEVIQFRFPNLRTETTYPAYVNYALRLNTGNDTPGIPATMLTLREYLALAGKLTSALHESRLVANTVEKNSTIDFEKRIFFRKVTSDDLTATKFTQDEIDTGETYYAQSITEGRDLTTEDDRSSGIKWVAKDIEFGKRYKAVRGEAAKTTDDIKIAALTATENSYIRVKYAKSPSLDDDDESLIPYFDVDSANKVAYELTITSANIDSWSE